MEKTWESKRAMKSKLSGQAQGSGIVCKKLLVEAAGGVEKKRKGKL